MSEYCPAGFMIGVWGLCGPEKEEGKVCLEYCPAVKAVYSLILVIHSPI